LVFSTIISVALTFLWVCLGVVLFHYSVIFDYWFACHEFLLQRSIPSALGVNYCSKGCIKSSLVKGCKVILCSVIEQINPIDTNIVLISWLHKIFTFQHWLKSPWIFFLSEHLLIQMWKWNSRIDLFVNYVSVQCIDLTVSLSMPEQVSWSK
jgi:hypothetical protein